MNGNNRLFFTNIIKRVRKVNPIASVPAELKDKFNQLCLKNTINRIRYLFFVVVLWKFLHFISTLFINRNNRLFKFENIFTNYDFMDIAILILLFLLMTFFINKKNKLVSWFICILFIIYNAVFSLMFIPSIQTSIEIQNLINPKLITMVDEPLFVTVEEAKKLKDDTYVLLKGTIETSLGMEQYLFSDHTGSLIIEIDDELFLRSSIDPELLQLPEQFEIIGEIDDELSWLGIDQAQLFILYIVVLILLPAFRPSIFIPFSVLYLLASLFVISEGYQSIFIYSDVKIFIVNIFAVVLLIKLMFYNNSVKSFILSLKLESSLNQQKKDEANRKELIAGISHDLRTPLTAIIGCVEGIKTGVASTQDKKEKYYDYIKSEASNMQHIIEQLFLFSKLDMNEFPLNMMRIDICLAVSEMIEDSISGYESRGLSIHITEMPKNILVMADVHLLRNVINNIIDNSIKYKTKDHCKIEISAEVIDNIVLLRFADDGPGIKEDMLQNLLNAFYRTDPSRSKSGSGLGLAISDKIIKSMGGWINAELPASGGLAIIIHFPIIMENS